MKIFKIQNNDKIRQMMLSGLSEHNVGDKLQKYSEPYKQLMAYYRCAIMEVVTKFNVLNEELSLRYDRNPIESVKSRLKSPKSTFDKMKRKNIPFTVEAIEENITDIAGVRVICSFQSDIYMLAEALLKQDDITLVEKKDYIQSPKENGYRSLHLIIETPIFLHDSKKLMKVEVQLRTISMDWWASLEHKICYKKNIPDYEQIRLDLRDCANIASSLDERMEDIGRKVDNSANHT